MLIWPKKAEHYRKVESYKLKNIYQFLKTYIEMEKKYKIWWYWNPKTIVSPA